MAAAGAGDCRWAGATAAEDQSVAPAGTSDSENAFRAVTLKQAYMCYSSPKGSNCLFKPEPDLFPRYPGSYAASS